MYASENNKIIELTGWDMEKQLSFHTFLGKVKHIERSKCIDAYTNIISFFYTYEKKLNLVLDFNISFVDKTVWIITFMKVSTFGTEKNEWYRLSIVIHLSSKFVVAATLTTISISFHICCKSSESFSPRLSTEISPGIGTTFSDTKAFRFSSPKSFLNTLKRSFSKTCWIISFKSD